VRGSGGAECLSGPALWGSGSWGVVTNSKHIPPIRPFRRPEAVGYPHIEPAIGVPFGRNTGNEEPYELPALPVGFGGVFFDLFYAVPER
jgi:hypothetical protein